MKNTSPSYLVTCQLLPTGLLLSIQSIQSFFFNPESGGGGEGGEVQASGWMPPQISCLRCPLQLVPYMGWSCVTCREVLPDVLNHFPMFHRVDFLLFERHTAQFCPELFCRAHYDRGSNVHCCKMAAKGLWRARSTAILHGAEVQQLAFSGLYHR